MDHDAFWTYVENASPANRELAGVVRELGRLYESRPPFDRSRSRTRHAEVLASVSISFPSAQLLAERLKAAEYKVGGDEHYLVRIDTEKERVFKITYGDAFGCFPEFLRSDPEEKDRHFYASINDDPIFYLRRWMLLNTLSGFQTVFEGFLPPEHPLKLPRICMSQPVLISENPTRSEIQSHLAIYGFRRISEDTYLHGGTHILLTDAAPRNVRIIDGIPVPFDAIASIASPVVIAWAAHR